MRQETSPVSFRANVGRLPAKGLPVFVVADAEQRERLAAIHGLISVERYRAELLVTPWKRNGVKVGGFVKADITQACVVTLDPIAAQIRATVDGLFLPEESKLGRQGFNSPGEIILDADGPDSPEIFTGDTIDVGALAEEFFGLGIDPYPRKADAAIKHPGEADGAPDGPLQQKLRELSSKS